MGKNTKKKMAKLKKKAANAKADARKGRAADEGTQKAGGGRMSRADIERMLKETKQSLKETNEALATTENNLEAAKVDLEQTRVRSVDLSNTLGQTRTRLERELADADTWRKKELEARRAEENERLGLRKELRAEEARVAKAEKEFAIAGSGYDDAKAAEAAANAIEASAVQERKDAARQDSAEDVLSIESTVPHRQLWTGFLLPLYCVAIP